MYINAVTDGVMLYLHDFYNIIFKIKGKLYIASGSAPPAPTFLKNSGGTPGPNPMISFFALEVAVFKTEYILPVYPIRITHPIPVIS
jgi:hypothetical protein